MVTKKVFRVFCVICGIEFLVSKSIFDICTLDLVVSCVGFVNILQ
jgi:hypothetical protein